MTISALICCRNNSGNLPKLLSTLRYVDKILVIDDHSSDGSSDICEDFGATVIKFPVRVPLWEMRKRLIQLCETRYFFFQDADDLRLNHIPPEVLDGIGEPIVITRTEGMTPSSDLFCDILSQSFHHSSVYWRTDDVVTLKYPEGYFSEYRFLFDAVWRWKIPYVQIDVDTVRYHGPGSLYHEKAIEVYDSRIAFCDYALQYVSSTKHLNRLHQTKKNLEVFRAKEQNRREEQATQVEQSDGTRLLEGEGLPVDKGTEEVQS